MQKCLSPSARSPGSRNCILICQGLHLVIITTIATHLVYTITHWPRQDIESILHVFIPFLKTLFSAYRNSICLYWTQRLLNVWKWNFLVLHIAWKLLKMSQLIFFLIWAFSTNFGPILSDLSGNTVWPQASDVQKLAKMNHFWHF